MVPSLLILLLHFWHLCGLQACPVKLLDVNTQNGGLFELQESGLEYLSEQRAPLYVVPVMGVFRGGKSFTLNRLMGRSAPYTGGFGVGHKQETFTRGVHICAEYVEELGTVVWMDTEGLFSTEYATSTYGPKIFSLALLFSSTVMLNSVKVLSNLFFSFFAEQQQVTRALLQGLAEEGLPPGNLLPKNLSIVWLLQQPVSDDTGDMVIQSQLHSFLHVDGDEGREKVQKDFAHHLAVVPAATNDVQLWPILNSLEDTALNPAYLTSMVDLRALVLRILRDARPLEARAVVGQIRMYAELVQTSNFSTKLAKEALEQSELAAICRDYAQQLRRFVGPLPSANFSEAILESRADAEVQGNRVADRIHFQKPWLARLRTCLDHAEDDLHAENDARIEAEWSADAQQIVEEEECYFLPRLVDLRAAKEKKYRCTLAPEVHDSILQQATSMQRARLVDCLKIKHLLMPLTPWVASPLLSFYTRDGLIAGLWTFAVHSVMFFGIYGVVQAFGQLPPFLDVDYPVLRHQPKILDAVMEVGPRVPWMYVGQGIAALGMVCLLLKILRILQSYFRPPGDAVAGIITLELKLNRLVQCQELMVQQQFLANCQDAEAYASRGDEHATCIAIMRALSMFTNSGAAAHVAVAHIDTEVQRRIEVLLDRGLPSRSQVGGQGSVNICAEWTQRRILANAMGKNWTLAINLMVGLLELYSRQAGRRQ